MATRPPTWRELLHSGVSSRRHRQCGRDEGTSMSQRDLLCSQDYEATFFTQQPVYIAREECASVQEHYHAPSQPAFQAKTFNANRERSAQPSSGPREILQTERLASTRDEPEMLPFSLEHYVKLFLALSRPGDSSVVQPCSPLDENKYTRSDLKQVLAMHGLSEGSTRSKREVLQDMVGMTLFCPFRTSSCHDNVDFHELTSRECESHLKALGWLEKPVCHVEQVVKPFHVTNAGESSGQVEGVCPQEQEAAQSYVCMPQHNEGNFVSTAPVLASDVDSWQTKLTMNSEPKWCDLTFGLDAPDTKPTGATLADFAPFLPFLAPGTKDQQGTAILVNGIDGEASGKMCHLQPQDQVHLMNFSELPQRARELHPSPATNDAANDDALESVVTKRVDDHKRVNSAFVDKCGVALMPSSGTSSIVHSTRASSEPNSTSQAAKTIGCSMSCCNSKSEVGRSAGGRHQLHGSPAVSKDFPGVPSPPLNQPKLKEAVVQKLAEVCQQEGLPPTVSEGSPNTVPLPAQKQLKLKKAVVQKLRADCSCLQQRSISISPSSSVKVQRKDLVLVALLEREHHFFMVRFSLGTKKGSILPDPKSDIWLEIKVDLHPRDLLCSWKDWEQHLAACSPCVEDCWSQLLVPMHFAPSHAGKKRRHSSGDVQRSEGKKLEFNSGSVVWCTERGLKWPAQVLGTDVETSLVTVELLGSPKTRKIVTAGSVHPFEELSKDVVPKRHSKHFFKAFEEALGIFRVPRD